MKEVDVMKAVADAMKAVEAGKKEADVMKVVAVAKIPGTGADVKTPGTVEEGVKVAVGVMKEADVKEATPAKEEAAKLQKDKEAVAHLLKPEGAKEINAWI